MKILIAILICSSTGILTVTSQAGSQETQDPVDPVVCDTSFPSAYCAGPFFDEQTQSFACQDIGPGGAYECVLDSQNEFCLCVDDDPEEIPPTIALPGSKTSWCCEKTSTNERSGKRQCEECSVWYVNPQQILQPKENFFWLALWPGEAANK